MKKLKVLDQNIQETITEELSLEKMKTILRKSNACYVLITCKEPSDDGQMQVEMSYEGDEALAAYLVESASEKFLHDSEQKTDPNQ